MSSHIISVLVKNRSGVLLRIAGLFARRGYNIDSLSVCQTNDITLSRMTIVTACDSATLKQIERQLLKQEDVLNVCLFDGKSVYSTELLLVKIFCIKDNRAVLLSLAQSFNANVVDIGTGTITIEATGPSGHIDKFIEKLESHGIAELARTGLSAIQRGDSVLSAQSTESIRN